MQIDFPIWVGIIFWMTTLLFYLLIAIIMVIVYNNIIPFKGFKAINFFGMLFVRKGCVINSTDLNHERIHTAQIKEMLYIGFYVWYILEWFIRLFKKGNAYRNISFEREAYRHQENLDYLNDRPRFAWWKYMKTF